MTKRRTRVLVMVALLTASSPALVACQTEEWAEEAIAAGGEHSLAGW